MIKEQKHDKMKKYYKITLIRGHMGARYDHATITFYEKATSMLEAIDLARKHGGVKHSKMPTNAVEITEDEYYSNRSTNAYDRAGCRKASFGLIPMEWLK